MSRLVTSDPNQLRIVMQYWRGRTRVCELEMSGSKLDVHILHNESESLWKIEAHSGHSSLAHVFSESGATSAAALSAVGRAWTDGAAALGLRAFDWEAVAQALRAVGAVS